MSKEKTIDDETLFKNCTWVLVSFNANAYDPEYIPELINNADNELLMQTKTSFSELIERRAFTNEMLYRITACTARDEKSARKFFEDVYKYAFEDGEEPDITDYWDRPKPTGWDATG